MSETELREFVKDLKNDIKELSISFRKFQLKTTTEIAVMKMENKSSAKLWGLIGGAIPVCIGLGIWAIKG